eukprot:CAMPEP_0180553320 /NCGR_PEP_ID=MMETSP1036_2-20121128/74258_1 /TAXON_ID=632150 /ORGANISM="Azadinium spinosum, Strain 3D9" /LENGTH=66 /DNA_ID=CAMNT_0022568917 /DNA_START=15 /DNA_END=212 /DNA_ORIENTATION=+
MLAKASEQLQGHDVQAVEAEVRPETVRALLQERTAVDILQVDIDCFDVSVLEAALSVVSPDVVILE